MEKNSRNFDLMVATVLKEALSVPPETKILGDVAAAQVACLAACVLQQCPLCELPVSSSPQCPVCLVCEMFKQTARLDLSETKAEDTAIIKDLQKKLETLKQEH